MEMEKALRIRLLYGNYQHFQKALEMIDAAERSDSPIMFCAPGYALNYAVPTELIPELKRFYRKAIDAARQEIADMD